MRPWLILLLVVISGCTNPPEALNPISADDLEIVVGEGREILAPPGSATAGSKWVEHPVTYTNKSAFPVWIHGHSETHPFIQIESRTNSEAAWLDYGLGYCGTGAKDYEIAPNASYSITAALPEKYIGQEFRVVLPFRNASQHAEAASKAHNLGTPVVE